MDVSHEGKRVGVLRFGSWGQVSGAIGVRATFFSLSFCSVGLWVREHLCVPGAAPGHGVQKTGVLPREAWVLQQLRLLTERPVRAAGLRVAVGFCHVQYQAPFSSAKLLDSGRKSTLRKGGPLAAVCSPVGGAAEPGRSPMRS